MANESFKVWRVLEETESEGGKVRTITKKEFAGEIENPKEEIYVTWMELAERFGEGVLSRRNSQRSLPALYGSREATRAHTSAFRAKPVRQEVS